MLAVVQEPVQATWRVTVFTGKYDILVGVTWDNSKVTTYLF